MHIVRKGVIALFFFSLAFLTLRTLPRRIFREGNTRTAGDWGEEVFCSVLQVFLRRRQEINLERLEAAAACLRTAMFRSCPVLELEE